MTRRADPRDKLGIPTPTDPITGERKDQAELWDRVIDSPIRLVHGLTTERVDDSHVALDALYIGRCKCGWESERPRSYTNTRRDYEDHSDNLWAVAR